MNIPRIFQGGRRTLFARLVANGLTQAGAAVGTAWLVKQVFDHMLAPQSRVINFGLMWAGLGLVAAAGVIAWLRMMERVDAERMGQGYASDVRMVLYDRLNSLAPRALQKRSQGGVALRFVGDMTALRRWVSLGLARLAVAAVMTVAALSALAVINWPLALIVTVVLCTGAAVAFSLGERLRTAARESRRRLSHLAANVNEKVASIAVVQMFGQSERERERISRQGQRLHDAMIERARVAGQILGVTEATAALASAAALLMGVFEVAAGQASLGTVVAAMALIGILMPPLRDLGRVQEYWHGARVSQEKLQEFLDAPSLVTDAPDAPDLGLGAGRLEFNGVSVAGGVDQVMAAVEPGTVVALVGPNGAGKSTLLSLAARLIDPDQGVVRLDGQDLAKHSLASVRRAIGMAGPDLPLLRGTVEKNLRYRWPDAPAQEIARVRALCGVDEVLAELPEGEKTRVAEGGVGLSAGQRQRIALARALLGNPPLLLLDEIDANLDPKAIAVVDRVLAGYRGTILLVTHRLDHLSSADVIWYMESGRVVESGSPAKLLSGNGPTARMFRTGMEAAS
ncbi:MAG: ABC transporter ATP-binding protein [Gammaproteobacteria bacterium]|nr:ABC transporter ATP-binding protein [Gammaproteobacteria bacterium]